MLVPIYYYLLWCMAQDKMINAESYNYVPCQGLGSTNIENLCHLEQSTVIEDTLPVNETQLLRMYDVFIFTCKTTLLSHGS